MSKLSLVKMLGVCALISAMCAACEDSDHGSEPTAQPTSPTDTVVEQQQQKYETATGTTGTVKLQYAYGGFKGGNAVEDPSVKIGGLKINGRSGMSYSWVGGSSLRVWGLADGDAGALACIFYQDAKGNWIGGKFDWISTSRRTRDFNNLNGGYGGWKPELFYAAKKHGFCIVSSDGKKRSNFITD